MFRDGADLLLGLQAPGRLVSRTNFAKEGGCESF